ncbi:Conserved_hypothetical protein [Hexamita inflata]|uniref:Transmembrane protein n=1 Tax=Hexamita inflata TaxID=28002 RepID=A0AA86PC14_9EUKA|nr:Conserved hypothetical protein [Hexamita inflata]
MINIFIICRFELSRIEKDIMYNCFEQNTDVNIFADSWDIYVTLYPSQSDCLIPAGILLSLQINSLGLYEPQAYVKDFNYTLQTQQILVRCTDPICSQLASATSSIVIIESKTQVTYVPVGSVQISRGIASNCFNDNDSYVELYHESIVAVLYPTFKCINSITSIGQDLILNTPYKAKVYITYSDNSITIHNELDIIVEDMIFVPAYQYSSQSVPIRIRLANQDISQYFEQKIIKQTENETITTKDMILFQIELSFNVSSTIIKTTQTLINYYKLMGIPQAFSNLTLTLLDNGFVNQKHIGPQANLANQYLQSLGVDWYLVEYIFVTYDVAKTMEFRARLIAHGVSKKGLFNNVPVQSSCEFRFPNQGCSELMKKLKTMSLSELSTSLTYQFYSGTTLVTNYSKMFDKFYDSCFSDGYLDYQNITKTLIIYINMYQASKSCTLKNHDIVQVKVILGNNSVELQQLDIDYEPGQQQYQIQGFDLSLHPEIILQFFRDSIIQDAVSISTYTTNFDDSAFKQQIIIIVIILACNLGFNLCYFILKFILVPYLQNCKRKVKINNKLESQFDDDVIE